MKIIVDFDKKTLSLDSDENLGKFFDKINQMFPENTWKEFTRNQRESQRASVVG